MGVTQGSAGHLGDEALVLRWIRSHSLQTFTLRECHQQLRGRFRRAAQLEPVIERLVARGHIEPVVPRPKVGRPPRLFRVLHADLDGIHPAPTTAGEQKDPRR
jgi:hypothetical protein